jgi:ADP-heptose:LPS heptosyltransferase
MKVAVFVSSGLGNAILLVPLLNKLKDRGDEITCISTANYGGKEFFEDCDLVDHLLEIRPDNSAWVKFNLKYKGVFGEAYLDNFASSRKILLSAQVVAKKVIAQNIPKNLPGLLTKKCREVKPKEGLHAAVQNLRLLDPSANNDALTNSSFSLPAPSKASKLIEGLSPYIALQPGSANDTSSYKNWPIEHWVELIASISIQYPAKQIVLLGDETDQVLADEVRADLGDAVISLVGKTSIGDLKSIIANCSLLVGVDSGLMHMAAVYGNPTFTLWGPSDSGLYGYETIDDTRHRSVSLHLPCSPCSSWLSPNTSRVRKPEDCPDFRCMGELTPEIVFNEFERFVQSQPSF